MMMQPVKNLKFSAHWKKIGPMLRSLLMMESQNVVELTSLFSNILKQRNSKQVIGELVKAYIELTEEIASTTFSMVVSSNSTLEEYLSGWARFYNGSRCIDKCCWNVNHAVVTHGMFPSNDCFFLIAMTSWHTKCFFPLSTKLSNESIERINKDRNGEMAELEPIHKLTASLYHLFEGPFIFDKLGLRYEIKPLKVYNESFEYAYLDSTELFFRRYATQSIASQGISYYITEIDGLLQRERIRVDRYLLHSTAEKMEARLKTELVGKFVDEMIKSCEEFFRAQNMEDLGKVYRLLRNNIEWCQPFANMFESYIISQGKQVSSVDTEGKEFQQIMDTVLDFYQRHRNHARAIFNDDSLFLSSFDRACRKIFNAIPNIAVSLAKFMDDILKKGKSKVEDRELSERLDNCLLIFKYVTEKDHFQLTYGRFLSTRLIEQNSVGEEHEKHVITKLKDICGYDYTLKFQRMFSDLEVCEGFNSEFKSDAIAQSLQIDLNVRVLTTNTWPFVLPQFVFNVPAEIGSALETMKTFYNKKYSGRKLQWLHAQGRGDIKVLGMNKPYEINVSTYQAAILLKFNRVDSASTKQTISMNDILTETGLPDPDFKASIYPLMAVKLLNKSPDAKNFSPTDEYSVNLAFKSERIKLKIGQAKEKEAVDTKERKTVEGDRKMLLEACCVRIMKSRMKMQFEDLVGEVMMQVAKRFEPGRQLVKTVIEGLIEREYLERLSDSPSTIQYVA